MCMRSGIHCHSGKPSISSLFSFFDCIFNLYSIATASAQKTLNYEMFCAVYAAGPSKLGRDIGAFGEYGSGQDSNRADLKL